MDTIPAAVAGPESAPFNKSFDPRCSTNQPRTPEPPEPATQTLQPPNPPKFRVKRRQQAFPAVQRQILDLDAVQTLPRIEIPETETLRTNTARLPQPLDDEYLTPTSATSVSQVITTPRTPVRQLLPTSGFSASEDLDWLQYSNKSKGRSISRPSSASSENSDWSVSSRSSSDTYPSFGGSCTSPESDTNDPFSLPETQHESLSKLSSPLQFQPHKQKRRRTTSEVKWTREMDEHLWVTYITYLSDPKVTPFKTLPGTAPPLGVCHRVAREAKRAWKGHGPALLQSAREGQFQSLDAAVRCVTPTPTVHRFDADSPETIRPASAEPRIKTGEAARKAFSQWPRSEASTRRRLRELCKRKPTLSPHYQRLMQTRSPSPFESSSSQRRGHSSRFSSPPIDAKTDTFEVRALNVDLITSTASTMQPDGPLAKLARDSDTSDNLGSGAGTVRSTLHQKSQSLQLQPGYRGETQRNAARRLASPFQENRPLQMWHSYSSPVTLPRAAVSNEPTVRGPAGGSLHIHAPRPMSGSMKRRAQYQLGEDLSADEADARRNMLHNLFGGPSTQPGRRVRIRGFSMGAMRHQEGRRQLSDLFDPPSTLHTEETLPEAAEPAMHSQEAEQLNVPPPDPVRRLGSPFIPVANNALSNTFPRSLFPHGLDSIAALDGYQAHADKARHDGEEVPSRPHQDPFY